MGMNSDERFRFGINKALLEAEPMKNDLNVQSLDRVVSREESEQPPFMYVIDIVNGVYIGNQERECAGCGLTRRVRHMASHGEKYFCRHCQKVILNFVGGKQ